MVERSGCSCWNDLRIERKVMQYQILPLKKRTFAEEMESKLEQYCKESKEILIHEELSK